MNNLNGTGASEIRKKMPCSGIYESMEKVKHTLAVKILLQTTIHKIPEKPHMEEIPSNYN